MSAIKGLTPRPILDVYDFVSRKGLLNLGLNVSGLIQNHKNVSVFLDDKEVLTGNLLRNRRATNALGLEAVILDAEVSETSKIMEHPIETGAVIADHKVINPVEIRLRITMPGYEYEPVIKELREYWRESVKLTVQTKAATYTNMVVCDIPHSETPQNVSRITFNIRLKQALEVKPQYIRLSVKQVKNPKNADTVKSGEKQTTSVLRDVWKGIKGFFK